MTTLGGGDESMPKWVQNLVAILAVLVLVGIAAVFGGALLLCTCALVSRLPRETSAPAAPAWAIVTVIGLLIGGLLLAAFARGGLSEFAIRPGSAKLRALDERVSDQQKAIRTALERVITRYEYDKLEGLQRKREFTCDFSDNLVAEMTRLYAHGFVEGTEPGSGDPAPLLQRYRGSGEFDLKSHYKLSEIGENYLQCIRQMAQHAGGRGIK